MKVHFTEFLELCKNNKKNIYKTKSREKKNKEIYLNIRTVPL